MDAVLVDGQPQVLGQRGGVALQHVKDGGAVQRPLPDKGHVGFVALLLREVGVLAVPAGYVLGTNTLAHVLWDIALNHRPDRRKGGREGRREEGREGRRREGRGREGGEGRGRGGRKEGEGGRRGGTYVSNSKNKVYMCWTYM